MSNLSEHAWWHPGIKLQIDSDLLKRQLRFWAPEKDEVTPTPRNRVHGLLSEADFAHLRSQVTVLPEVVQNLLDHLTLSGLVRYGQFTRELNSLRAECAHLREEVASLRKLVSPAPQRSVAEIVTQARIKAFSLTDEERNTLMLRVASLRREGPESWTAAELAQQIDNFVEAEIKNSPDHSDDR